MKVARTSHANPPLFGKSRTDIAARTDQQMSNAMTAFDLSSNTDGRGMTDLCAKALVDLWSKDQIGNSGLVLDRHKNNPLGCGWSLPDKNQTREKDHTANRSAILVAKKRTRNRTSALQTMPNACNWVALERDPCRLKILGDS